MKKKIPFFAILFFIKLSLTAQEKLMFSSQNFAGLLEGNGGSALQLQTINGVMNNKWFAGVGTGLDYYRYRSIPVFISLNRIITNKKPLFLSLDGGINYAWVDRERSRTNDFISSRFSPALYWASGLGYKIYSKNKKDAAVFSVGYSYKHLKEKQEKFVFCTNPPCAPAIEYYDYRLKRISVRLGWQF